MVGCALTEFADNYPFLESAFTMAMDSHYAILPRGDLGHCLCSLDAAVMRSTRFSNPAPTRR